MNFKNLKAIDMTKTNEHITTIVLDCDGVLTPATQHITVTGDKLFKAFNARDLVALRALDEAGYDVYVVSADDWAGTKYWVDKTKATFIYSREKHTLDLPWDKTLACADDFFLDGKMLMRAMYSAVPADACILLKNPQFGHHTLKSKGGEGLVYELIHTYNLLG